MRDRVKVRLRISEDLYKLIKQHADIDWNEAAISGIAKRLAAVNGVCGGKERQSQKPNHHKL